jgi:shikimate kinase
MKIRTVVILVGLAFSFALPAFAQQKDAVKPPIAQQRDLLADVKALYEFGALGTKEEEAFNKNDASAVAALFTEDAVLVAPGGMFSVGRLSRKGMQTCSSSRLLPAFPASARS